jgi:hypothetical protein
MPSASTVHPKRTSTEQTAAQRTFLDINKEEVQELLQASLRYKDQSKHRRMSCLEQHQYTTSSTLVSHLISLFFFIFILETHPPQVYGIGQCANAVLF